MLIQSSTRLLPGAGLALPAALATASGESCDTRSKAEAIWSSGPDRYLAAAGNVRVAATGTSQPDKKMPATRGDTSNQRRHQQPEETPATRGDTSDQGRHQRPEETPATRGDYCFVKIHGMPAAV
jgi:hypothetical protein